MKYMPAYNVLFFGMVFFIFGILLASIHAGWIIFALTAFAALGAAGFFFLTRNKKYLALIFISPAIFAGAFYAEAFDMNLKASSAIVSGANSAFEGNVVDVSVSDYSSTRIVIALRGGGKVLVALRRYSNIRYGDRVAFRGAVEKPPAGGYADYLLKEGIIGTSNFPEIISVESGNGGYRGYLFDLRDKVLGIFKRTLPQKESAFLSGLLLGYRGGFSDDFTSAMQSSGTTHLVALSGYNVSLVVIGAMALFSFFAPRALAFTLTSIAIFLFVTMTGAEASVVRAALFGFLVLLATESGRFFNPRNVIVLAAFLMLLGNPKLLVFDVGFELSFAAFLGIMYLKPAVTSFAKFLAGGGLMDWKDHLASTFSAQLAVLPIIAGSFGSFSPLSILSNMLVLSFIPTTMGLGFAAAALGFLSERLASAAAFLTFPFLKFETAVIVFFGELHSLVALNFGFWVLCGYYCCLIAFILWRKKKTLPN